MTDVLLKLSRIRTACADGTARRTRLDAHLPASTLARELGVSPSTLSRWERGIDLPNGDDALRYWTLLDQLSAL